MELSEGQKALILKYLLTGAAIGGTSNLALNLISYLKDKANTLEHKDRLQKNVIEGDKVYTIDPKELEFLNKTSSEIEKPGFLNNTLAQALAVIASAGGLYGGYKLADLIHDAVKNKEVTEEEQKEAEAYYKKLYLLQQAQQKNASEESLTKEAKASTLIGTGLGLLLLTSIGSGLLTRSIMKKHHPMLNTEELIDSHPIISQRPKSVKIIEKDEIQDMEPNESVGLDSDSVENTNKDPNEISAEETADDFEKVLAKYSFDMSKTYCNEALLKLCYNFEKSGRQGSVSNLVKSASCGFTQNLKEIVEKGYNKDLTIFDLADKLAEGYTKEASTDDLKEQLAISWLASEPQVSSAIMPQVAAEFANHAPTYYKLAASVPQSAEPLFATLLSSQVINDRCAIFEKYAKQIEHKDTLSFKQASEKFSEDVNESDCYEYLLNNLNYLTKLEDLV